MPSKTAIRTQPTPLGSKKPVKAPPTAQKAPLKEPVPATVRPQAQKSVVPISTSATPKPSTHPLSRKPAPSQPKKPILPGPSNNKKPTTVPAKSTLQNQKSLLSTKPVNFVGGTPPAASKENSNVAAGNNWINRTVQNRIAGVGNYAGGWVNSVGERVDKIGEGIGGRITDMSRSWGQGVAGYGNNIKDSVGVGGPRVATARNPLGMAGQGADKK